jgi:protein-tyrosine kinase
VSIIEQAARRLEELRRSGVEVSNGARSSEGNVLNTDSFGHVPAKLGRMLEEAALQPRSSQTPAQQTSTSQTFASARAQAVAAFHEAQKEAVEPFAQESQFLASRQVAIDLAWLSSMGYVSPQTPRTQIANEFRVIKRTLLANVKGKSAPPLPRANLIMVTSSMPAEGKTLVAINLAISLAMELDKRVLLVDADVSRPMVLKRLGLSPSPGLLDLLTDAELPVSEVLLRTNIEKLSILPSGRPHGHATELLSSDAMVHFLNELATRYHDRIVVFDAPPLLPSTECRTLATGMGQVVLVVEAERTLQKTVIQALSMIESCPVVLPLLNKTSQTEVGSYYAY